MATWICEVSGDPVQAGECIDCARRHLIPECDWASPGILRRLERSLAFVDPTLSTDDDIPTVRVSELAQCLRKSWYQRKRGSVLERPSDHWARLRGTIFHEGFENGVDGEEMRLFALVEHDDFGIARVAGRVDWFDEEYGVLHDYKTVKRFHVGLDLPKETNLSQMTFYCWLLEKNGYTVNRVCLSYVSMDGIRSIWIDRHDLISFRDEDVASIVAHVLSENVPDVDSGSVWECRWCPFSDVCEKSFWHPNRPSSYL